MVLFVVKREIMKLADVTNKKEKNTYCSIGGGTFSANPLTMTAGYDTLKYLKKNPTVYEKINSLEILQETNYQNYLRN